jgi:aminopeptidase N
MITRHIALLLFLTLLGAAPSGSIDTIHHDLEVALDPQNNRFDAQMTMTLPPDRPDTLVFALHPGLNPRSATPGVHLERLAADGRAERFGVRLPPGLTQLALRYGGRLHYPLQAPADGHGRGFEQTMGHISPQGVYLTGGSLWYPRFAAELLTFSLRIKMPTNWHAVSQGSRIHAEAGEVTWSIDKPQRQIFLIAGPFTEYKGAPGRIQAMVYLRRPDPDLARTYLTATDRYIAFYEQLIGFYPYDKFALVENFWETGFGMPSFTLMGSRVIRLPFIPHTSYPHEILHNWWGNSVYPDHETGNWSEGLTAYMADHLLREQDGQGSDYRETVLQRYTDYVREEKDFPLSQFTGRHDPATEAVGYGKAMMFFHMLRRQLGDETFTEALQVFYRRCQFQNTAFDDLRRTFESVAGEPLEAIFRQWVHRTGAPRLTVEAGPVARKEGRYLLEITLRQTQPDPAYTLHVPLALTVEGETAARPSIVTMHESLHKVTLTAPARPLRLDVDPRFDLFRRLARTEIPPALTQLFAAQTVVAVLPSSAGQERLEAYREFARTLEHAGPQQVLVVLDRDLDRLPDDRHVVLLGWDNRFRDAAAKAAASYGARVEPSQAVLNGKTIPRRAHSVVLTVRHPASEALVLAWVAADPPGALGSVARRLPHFHRYSYLAFAGSEAENIVRGRWPVKDSPMTLFLTDERADMGRLPPETPLAILPP